MIKSILLPAVLVLLLLGLTGCSRPAPAPVVSIPNEKPSIQTPTEPPQGFKDLWAEANPLPEWTNTGQSGTNKLPQQTAADDGKSPEMEKILQKLAQIERPDIEMILQKLEQIDGRLVGIEKMGRFQHLTAAEIEEEVDKVFDGIMVANLCKIKHPPKPEFSFFGFGFNH